MGYALGRWIDLVLLVGIAIPIAIIDIRDRKIPDVLVLCGLALFLVTKIFLNNDISLWVILDATIGFLSIASLWFITKGGIGLGDAKLSGLLAFLLGIYYWGIALLVASIAGLLIGGILILLKKMGRKDGIPFAPFLATGAIVSYILKYFLTKVVTGVWQSIVSFPK